MIYPYLSVTDATAAIEFYSSVFGQGPVSRIDMPDGRVMHCEFQIGGSAFYLSEELPEHGGTPSPTSLGATTVAMHLYVEDCDSLMEAMKACGAIVLMEPEDMFWGERFGRVRDPFGHEWGIAQKIREMTPREIEDAANELFRQMNDPSDVEGSGNEA